MANQVTRSGYYARAQNMADHVVDRKTRQQYYDAVGSFCAEQPYLASFLIFQIALSIIPIALFAILTAGTLLFSLTTALLFSSFWIGLYLLFLIPTLFITISTAVALWAWAICSFLTARWLYNLIPVSVRGDVEVDMPNGKTVVVNKTGEGFGDLHADVVRKVEGVKRVEVVDVKVPADAY